MPRHSILCHYISCPSTSLPFLIPTNSLDLNLLHHINLITPDAILNALYTVSYCLKLRSTTDEEDEGKDGGVDGDGTGNNESDGDGTGNGAGDGIGVGDGERDGDELDTVLNQSLCNLVDRGLDGGGV